MKCQLPVLAGALVASAIALAMAAPAHATAVVYEIRGTPIVQAGPGPGSTEIIIDDAGDKAAIGSNKLNGAKLGSIAKLSIDRLDDRTRFTPGSGPHVAPYLNIWITDGAGRFAVVANEPSNPEFQSLYVDGYSLAFSDLADKTAKIFETNDTSWLPNNGVGLTFADLADFIIQAPTAAQIAAMPWLGTGAPRELGTNIAYGVSWVFGDTLSNYVSGDAGYIVANARFSVPEPDTLVLLGVGLAGLGLIKRRARR